MSFDNVITFWRKVQDDTELQQKVSPLEEQSAKDRCRGAAKIAREAGFEVTDEEVWGVGQVVDFWQQAESDQALAAKVKIAHEQETPQEAFDAISAIAKETGYDLPQEALSKVTAAMVEGHDALGSDGGLSEADLAGVAGGASSGRFSGSYDMAVKKKWAKLAKMGPGQVGAKP